MFCRGKKGPGFDFQTIQGAIDHFARQQAGPTTIKIAKGQYAEQLKLECIGAGANLQFVNVQNSVQPDQYRGLQIVGDDRRYAFVPPYINEFEYAGSPLSQRAPFWTLTDGVDNYAADIATTFGTIQETTGGTLVLGTVLGAPEPPTLSFNGNVALIPRGSIAFAEKASTAQSFGASAVVIYNSAAGGDSPIGMSGINLGINIPVHSIGNNDGLDLVQKIMNNGGSLGNINITSNTPGAYFPAAGTNYGKVKLEKNGNVLTVTLTTTPIADDNIVAQPVLANPNFGSLGWEAGDRVYIGEANILSLKNAGFVFPGTVYTIQSVNGNQITFTDPIAEDVSVKGASLTLLPNVEVYPPTTSLGTALRAISVSGVSITGLTLSTDPAAGLADFGYVVDSIALSNSQLNLANVVVVDPQAVNAGGATLRLENSAVVLQNGLTGDVSTFASLNWNSGLSLTGGSALAGAVGVNNNSPQNSTQGTVVILQSSSNAVTAYDSALRTGNIQAIGLDGIAVAQAPGILLENSTWQNIKLADFSQAFSSLVSLKGSSTFTNETASVRLEDAVFINGEFKTTGGLTLQSGSKFIIRKGEVVLLAVENGPAQEFQWNATTDVSTITGITKSNFEDCGDLDGIGLNVGKNALFSSEATVKFENNDINVKNLGGEVDIETVI